jgi:hypothetical protein
MAVVLKRSMAVPAALAVLVFARVDVADEGDDGDSSASHSNAHWICNASL